MLFGLMVITFIFAHPIYTFLIFTAIAFVLNLPLVIEEVLSYNIGNTDYSDED